jgi:hypothetical protein
MLALGKVAVGPFPVDEVREKFWLPSVAALCFAAVTVTVGLETVTGDSPGNKFEARLRDSWLITAVRF